MKALSLQFVARSDPPGSLSNDCERQRWKHLLDHRVYSLLNLLNVLFILLIRGILSIFSGNVFNQDTYVCWIFFW